MKKIVYVVGGAANAGPSLGRFMRSMLRDGEFVLQADFGIDRSARVPGAGFLNVTGFLPQNVTTVEDAFRYVEENTLGDRNATPLTARVSTELDLLTNKPDPASHGADTRTFRQKAGRFALDKGGYAMPAWARIVYEASRPRLQPWLFEQGKSIIQAEREVVGNKGHYEFEIVVVFGLGGGVGAALEKFFPGDAEISLKRAFEDLKTKREIGPEAKLSVSTSRIGIGYESYLHARNSDGILLPAMASEIERRCDDRITEMTAEGRTCVVLNAQGTDIGPALYNLIKLAPSYDRLNINELVHNTVLPMVFVTTRVVTPATLARITRNEAMRYDGKARSNLLSYDPGNPGGLFGFGRKEENVAINQVNRIGSRRHLAAELAAIKRTSVDQFAREHGFGGNRDMIAAARAGLEQYKRWIERQLETLPNDGCGMLCTFDFESPLQDATMDLPMKLTPELFNEVPFSLLEFGIDEGVFFPREHHMHERRVLTGKDENDDPHVVMLLAERGLKGLFRKSEQLDIYTA